MVAVCFMKSLLSLCLQTKSFVTESLCNWFSKFWSMVVFLHSLSMSTLMVIGSLRLYFTRLIVSCQIKRPFPAFWRRCASIALRWGWHWVTHRRCGPSWWLAVAAVALGARHRSRGLSTPNVVICSSAYTSKWLLLFQIMRRLDGVRWVRMRGVGRMRSGGGCARASPGGMRSCGGCVRSGRRQWACPLLLGICLKIFTT